MEFRFNHTQKHLAVALYLGLLTPAIVASVLLQANERWGEKTWYEANSTPHHELHHILFTVFRKLEEWQSGDHHHMVVLHILCGACPTIAEHRHVNSSLDIFQLPMQGGMNEREICTVSLNLVYEFVKSITELEILSRMNKDQVLDDDIEIEEVELSVKKKRGCQ